MARYADGNMGYRKWQLGTTVQRSGVLGVVLGYRYQHKRGRYEVHVKTSKGKAWFPIDGGTTQRRT